VFERHAQHCPVFFLMQTGRPVARNYEGINPLTRSRSVEHVIEFILLKPRDFPKCCVGHEQFERRKITIGSRAPDPGAIRYVRYGKLLATAQQFCGNGYEGVTCSQFLIDATGR
jgi:hypothetical protein